MSNIKETNFFTDFLVSAKNRNIKKYERFFSHCADGAVIGEFSPHYLSDEKAPFLIKKNFPNVKLIACFRNPVEQLYSYYRFTKQRGRHSFQSFEEFLEKEDFGAKKKVLYYVNLKKWLHVFSREQILILIYKDISENPKHVLRQTFEFLNVDKNFIPSKANEKVNPSGEFKGWFLSRLAYKIIYFLQGRARGDKVIAWLLRSRIKVLFDRAMQSSTKQKKQPSATQEPISPSIRKKLQKMYEEDIKGIESLINRDLSFWRQ